MRSVSVVATPAADRAAVRHGVARRDVLTVVAPLAAGTIGALALLSLYAGLVSWAQGMAHARQLLWDDRYFAGAISLGFGIQIALYTYIRIVAARAALAAATGVTAAGTGTSTAAMVACCAHHVADARGGGSCVPEAAEGVDRDAHRARPRRRARTHTPMVTAAVVDVDRKGVATAA